MSTRNIRSHSVLTPLRFVLIVAAVLAITWALVIALSGGGRTPPVQSDELGPWNGEAMASYYQRAAASLADSAPGERWSLVSFDAALTPEQTAAVLAAAAVPRVSEVIIVMPGPAGASQILTGTATLPQPGEDSQAPTLLRAVRATLLMSPPGPYRDQLQYAIDHGEGSLCGLVVRAEPEALRALSAHGSPIRTVEALPPDAVWGRFAVRPLLPEQRDVYQPVLADADRPASPLDHGDSMPR